VRLAAEQDDLARARPVVAEERQVAPAGPGELDAQCVKGRDRLCLTRALLPANPDGRIRPRIDRRLEQHLAPWPRDPVEHPEQRQMERTVVEHAEEEDDVERLKLTKLHRRSEVAVDPAVRRAQAALPLLVEVPVGCEVREDELTW